MKTSCFVDENKLFCWWKQVVLLMEISRFLTIPDIVSLTACLTWVRRKVVKAFLYLSESRGQASAAFSCDISLLCSTLRRGIILYDGPPRLGRRRGTPRLYDWERRLSPPHGNISGGIQYYSFWKSVLLLSQYQPTETPVPVGWYWKGYCTSGNMELYMSRHPYDFSLS